MILCKYFDGKCIHSIYVCTCVEYDSESLQEDLATLSSEINIKQKLIDQLEGAQRTMQAMKKQYEEKLQTLHIQINKTESERDRVLRELCKCIRTYVYVCTT